MFRNRTEGCSTYAIDYAAKNGYIDVVKFLVEVMDAKCTSWAMRFAIENEHIHIVKYLLDNKKCKLSVAKRIIAATTSFVQQTILEFLATYEYSSISNGV